MNFGVSTVVAPTGETFGLNVWDLVTGDDDAIRELEQDVKEASTNILGEKVTGQLETYVENKAVKDLKNLATKELQDQYLKQFTPEQRQQLESKAKDWAIEGSAASIGDKIGVFIADLMKGKYNKELMIVGGGFALVTSILIVKKVVHSHKSE